MSKAEIDRLGKRLRVADPIAADDLAMYDAYRGSFSGSLQDVLSKVAAILPSYPVTARLKRLESVRAKLQRQSIRLSQIADIGGARVVVPDLDAQESALALLLTLHPNGRVIDHRVEPQNGYRAVHLIAAAPAGRAVEIQIRTECQDAWANISEAIASRVGLEVKYGHGPAEIREDLDRLSKLAADYDYARRGLSRSAENWARLEQQAHQASITEEERQVFLSEFTKNRLEVQDMQASVELQIQRFVAFAATFRATLRPED